MYKRVSPPRSTATGVNLKACLTCRVYMMSFPLASTTASGQKAPQLQQPAALAPPPVSRSSPEDRLRRRASTDRRASIVDLEGQVTSRSGSASLPPSLPPAAQHLCLLLDITARKPKRIGKYIVGKQLGKGAFGTVRLGKDSATGTFPAFPCFTLLYTLTRRCCQPDDCKKAVMGEAPATGCLAWDLVSGDSSADMSHSERL